MTDITRTDAVAALTRNLDLAPVILAGLQRAAEGVTERLLGALQAGLTAGEYARVLAVLAGEPHEPETTP